MGGLLLPEQNTHPPTLKCAQHAPATPPTPCLAPPAGSVYGEVEALSTLLGYRCQNAGCCKIVLHPRWGSSVYPATLFARAPVEAVAAAIEEAVAEVAPRLA